MTSKRAKPTPEQMRQWFRLDEATGRIYWKPQKSRYVKAGQEAFTSKRPNGARQGRVPGFGLVSAAAVVWCLSRGKWPDGSVCHVNGVLTDNRPDNLAERGSGDYDRRPRSDSGTRISGVQLVSGRWRARATVAGRVRHLGMFDDVAQATQAVQAARAAEDRRRAAKSAR